MLGPGPLGAAVADIPPATTSATAATEAASRRIEPMPLTSHGNVICFPADVSTVRAQIAIVPSAEGCPQGRSATAPGKSDRHLQASRQPGSASQRTAGPAGPGAPTRTLEVGPPGAHTEPLPPSRATNSAFTEPASSRRETRTLGLASPPVTPHEAWGASSGDLPPWWPGPARGTVEVVRRGCQA